MKIFFNFMIFFINLVFTAESFRISSFYDRNIKLIHNKKNELLTSFVHAHDDPKFYFEIPEVSPGYVKILSNDSNEIKIDKNSNTQLFKLKLTPDGGFRIFKEGYCLTLVDNSTLSMESCSTGENQVFMILKGNNDGIINPISNVTYTFDFQMKPSHH